MTNLCHLTSGSESPTEAWMRALAMTAPIARNRSVTLPVVIDALADKFGADVALLSERECLTYRAIADRSNRYSCWALRQGLAPGDVVCLLMPNCPEYFAIWIGITRLGAIVSLLNTQLSGDCLAHAISLVAPKCIIVGSSLVERLAVVAPRLAPSVRCWVYGGGDHDFPRIDEDIKQGIGDRLASYGCRLPSIVDQALYIYTSGTTGLPKAAKVSHFRLMQWSHWFAGMMGIRPSDRMYNCLPMYHSIGGVVAVGAMLVNGGSVVLRQQFSASRFWDEVVECNCTVFQYIGELCRYLVNSPPAPREAEHRIRLCCGNGLRADVWEEFKRRFRIPQILEFYAATEGNFALYNCEGKPGAIGRIPLFLGHRSAVALVKCDAETGKPVRNENGFCTRCSDSEIGEAIGRIINDPTNPGSRFEGYADNVASEVKILRDVFVKGDAWLRTGDLMRRDESGYFYFVDRIGDTFRWKGENVSTTQVAEAIGRCSGIRDAVVYGVKVPGVEGRAGMAVLIVDRNFNLTAFRQELVGRLPGYACPLFLRIRSKIETTATLKPRKQDLVREGYDPAATTDPIYFNDWLCQAFVRLSPDFSGRIRAGSLRL
jgi:fatty-acyl-CoA synthase